MKKKLVIFGTGEMAETAHYYFSMDSDYEVIAFTIDGKYIKETTFCALPVIAFEDVVSRFSPRRSDVFVAIGYSRLNTVRKEKCAAAAAVGYRLATYVSSKATILNGGRTGSNCFILENCTIQPFVRIGDGVIVWTGAFIGHHSTIKSHTFIAPHAAIAGVVEIGEQCFIGINATLRDHIKVGDRCVIGAGAVLLEDAEPEGVYKAMATERSKLSSRLLSKV